TEVADPVRERLEQRMRFGFSLRAAAVAAGAAIGLVLVGVAPVRAVESEPYLDLPLVNRKADQGPGGVNPALPYDAGRLRALLDEARGQGIAPRRYAALLYQYWLVEATNSAGIDLASWNPR